MKEIELIPKQAQLQVMRALVMAYKKHALGHESIDSNELNLQISIALQTVMGDEQFCEWVESITGRICPN